MTTKGYCNRKHAYAQLPILANCFGQQGTGSSHALTFRGHAAQ
jgi:hypothetical protein